jgi:predicted nucleic acid-binding protein
MKLRLYFDTSVFGGVFDEEFQEISILLFDKIKSGEITCVYSNLCTAELKSAPEKVRNFFIKLPKENMEFIEVSEDAYNLAQKYLDEKVVGQTSSDDCTHIAVATISKVDYLVSWNFKHIVNVFRIRGYNSVNMRYGYMQLDIRSPKEIVNKNEDSN